MLRKSSRIAPSFAELRAPTCARGFTLVELLVALFILSIGLLGVGKVILYAARANDSAYQRSEATMLAYQILDNMRANRASAAGGDYTVALGPYANPGVDCAANPCVVTSVLAQYDLYQWKSAMLAALGPAGDGSVTVVAGADPISGATLYTATIVVQWDDTLAQQTFGASAPVPNQVNVTLESVL